MTDNKSACNESEVSSVVFSEKFGVHMPGVVFKMSTWQI